MKYIILILFLITGCTTVYKVDSKGVCRAPDGKIVAIPKLDKWKAAGSFMDKLFPDGRATGSRRPCLYSNPFEGGSAFGGFYGSDTTLTQ